MNEIYIKKLHELIKKIKDISDSAELDSIFKDFVINDNESGKEIFADLKIIAQRLVERNELLSQNDENKRISTLTIQEQTELAECERLIKENLFGYHFQPIVNAHNGEIYAYEALMRPKSDICPSPFHVMKYAEFMHCINEIEKQTFLNILHIIENENNLFKEKRVFINSIPRAKLSVQDAMEVNQLLSLYSNIVVVEMTEQSELDDSGLARIKDNYNKLNIKIAIDDYGTGYSNVQNLLRYMPDYVKIDRSLISEIDNSPKKRHFVREIIEFCHGNDIMALAEGVETADEMRTLILLGIDLIQGYYTARPAANVISSIALELKQEIMLYQQERQKGKELRIYYADNSERVLLDRLSKEEYRRVVVGKNGKGDATLVSTPGFDTNIHVEVASGFKGELTIEGTELSNDYAKPCIDIGENCDVTLYVIGANKLNHGGIRVPESSRLTITGDGRLTICIDGAGFYGIGNDAEMRHGELIFEDTGIFIESNAVSGICIGSGLGGIIRILRGQFVLRMSGVYNVGIGALYADTDLDLFACDVTIDISTFIGADIGSLDGNVKISIHNASTKLSISGDNIVGIGSVKGELVEFSALEANVSVNTSGDKNAAIASLYGDTTFKLNKASLNIVGSGTDSYAIGGINKIPKVILTNSNTNVKLDTSIDYTETYNDESFEISGGRLKVIINNEEIINQ